jgi:hypothetical protein
MNVTSLQTPTYAESSRAITFEENNWTQWTMSPSQGGVSMNSSKNGLLLTGNFPASTEPFAFSISRSLAVNLTAYPIMYMLIKVSSGVSYGIRFYSRTSGLVVPLWSETDAFNHRPGTGEFENVQVNMPQVIELNTGKIFNEVTDVTVYVERGSSIQKTDFSIQIGKFEFLDYPLGSAQLAGSYHAIYVGLSQIQEMSSLTLRSVKIQARLNASMGTVFVPYFIKGLEVYSGAVYSITVFPFDVSITIDIPVQNAKLFSDRLPIETAAFVIVAASGTLTQMLVESISLNYFSRAAQTSSLPSQGPAAVYVDYGFFMLLLPASVILLLYAQRRRTKIGGILLMTVHSC